MIALSGVAALVILGLSRQYINEDAVSPTRFTVNSGPGPSRGS